MNITAIVMEREAGHTMRYEADVWAPLESGGILIGRVREAVARVQVATVSGPQAEHTIGGFMRDGAFSQERLDEVVRDSQGAWDYLGEWHTHSRPVPASRPDARSMREIAEDPAYKRSRPILLVLLRERRRWVFRGYQWRSSRLLEVTVRCLSR